MEEGISIKKAGLNGWQLKLIAIAAMTADHIAWVVFPGYSRAPLALALHLLGRLTAPIMCFFIAEGFHYTRSVKNYFLRLLLFALPSHFAYMFCFGHPLLPFAGGLLNQTSVLWPFAWGVAALAVCSGKLPQWQKVALVLLICAITFPSDWSCIAVLCIMGFYFNRGDLRQGGVALAGYTAMYAAVYFFCLDRLYGLLQMGVVLALPLLARYNGQRGRSTRGAKWFFYIYYPLHLVLLGLLRLALA